MNLSVLIFSMGVVDRHIDRWDLDYIKKKMLLTEEQKGVDESVTGRWSSAYCQNEASGGANEKEKPNSHKD